MIKQPEIGEKNSIFVCVCVCVCVITTVLIIIIIIINLITRLQSDNEIESQSICSDSACTEIKVTSRELKSNE